MSELAAALAKVQAEIPSIEKGKTAKVKGKTRDGTPFEYSYNYADLADVSRAIMHLLGKHGLAFTARPTLDDERFVLAYSLIHASGEREDGDYPLPDPVTHTPQQVGGAITYARRYCLCAVTGVAAEEDDDGQTAAAASPPAKRVKTAHTDPEHVRLVHGLTGRGRVEGSQRTNGPVPDDQNPWQDQPAGHIDLPPPENRPGTIDGRQRSRLHGAFIALGIRDREQRIEATAKIIGRAIESSNDLSYVEAEQVISELQTKVKVAAAAAGDGDG